MCLSLARVIRGVLLETDPRAKLMQARAVARDWRLGRLDWAFDVEMPERPGRPECPELLPPKFMPKRGRGQSDRARVALWHAVAHIEFVAIDLALDMAGRFGADMGADFVSDFLAIAADEAIHFALLDRHLRRFGSHYGDLPAHDGLWQAAVETRHDVAARLAVVPMVLEARGLDVTPQTILRVRGSGDDIGARILERILADEIRHVRAGVVHFQAVCARRNDDPDSAWRGLVTRHFRGMVKPPFNDSARAAAGLSPDMYNGLAV